MKFLSFDLEATGLESHDLIIEFACVPIDASTQSIEEQLQFHRYIKCPSFLKLQPHLSPWVIENNKELIEKAHTQGAQLVHFKQEFESYLTSEKLKEYFALSNNDKIVLLGKSLNAIDLPFLNRDLGFEFMRKHFSHRQLDVTSLAIFMIDGGHLPKACLSGSKLMEYFSMGEVAHTALEDAINTAKLYFQLLSKVQKGK